MQELIFNRLSAIWLGLIGATLLSVESVGGLFPGAGASMVTAVVVVVACVKVRFVGLDFMELRHAPLVARLAFEAWVFVLCIAILAIEMLGIGA